MQAPHPQLAQAIALSNAGCNDEAVLIVRRLAAARDPAALFLLAQMLWGGGILAQDPVEGRRQFEAAAQAGHPVAAIVATNLLASGIAGPRDWPRALARMAGEARTDPRRTVQADLLARMALGDGGSPASLPASERLSDAPDVQLFPRLVSAAECAYLVELASRAFQPAQVRNPAGGMMRDPIRASDESTLHWMIEDPVVHAINRRLAAICGTDAAQGEAMQILRYRPGQQYRAHYDFNPTLDNQREWTALIYLNHDYRGGETAFVKTGLKVKGRKGDVLLFRNMIDGGAVDPMSQHAGLPVTQGIKYLATRWARERRFAP